MKKLILAGAVAVALCAMPNIVVAGPPGFYASGYSTTPFPLWPSTQSFNYFASPYGYRTFNSTGIAATPFGYNAYNYGGTFVRPYSVGPVHSVYWDPFTNSYQYGPGRLNSPTFYQTTRYRWGW